MSAFHGFSSDNLREKIPVLRKSIVASTPRDSAKEKPTGPDWDSAVEPAQTDALSQPFLGDACSASHNGGDGKFLLLKRGADCVIAHLTFDKRYASMIGVSAHEDAVKLFQKSSKEAQDPDVKTFAAKTLPGLQEHLQMGRDLKKTVDAAKK